jgi:hypothetical protein
VYTVQQPRKPLTKNRKWLKPQAFYQKPAEQVLSMITDSELTFRPLSFILKMEEKYSSEIFML